MPCCATRSLVLAVLEHRAERGVDRRVSSSSVAPSAAERLRPVDRLGDAGRLVQVESAQRLDRGRHLAGERLVDVGHAQAHDRDLAVEVGVLDPVVQAAPLQRVVHVAGAVRREHDDRRRGRP